MESFVAFDLETANSSPDSVCEVAFVKFEKGELVDSWKSLIRPKSGTLVDARNFMIHGIRAADLEDAPLLLDVWGDIINFIDGNWLVAHGATQDIKKLLKSLSPFANSKPIKNMSAEYLCTLTVARRAPFELADYTLGTLADHFQIEYRSHNRNGINAHTADRDAEVAGWLALSLLGEACATTFPILLESLDMQSGQVADNEVKRGCTTRYKSSFWNNAAPNAEEFAEICREIDEAGLTIQDHPLKNKSIVMTLSMNSMTEAEFVLACAITGAQFKTSVSSKLDYLLEGDDSTGKYKRGETSKSVKAREINVREVRIQIIDEEEFLGLLGDEVIVRITNLRAARSEGKKPPEFVEDAEHRKYLDQKSEKNEIDRQKRELEKIQFLKKPSWSEKVVKSGDVIAFTMIPESEYEDQLTQIAENLGILVTKSISKKVDLLVIYTPEVEKSSKLRDALAKGIAVTTLDTFLKNNAEFPAHARRKSSFLGRFFQ